MNHNRFKKHPSMTPMVSWRALLVFAMTLFLTHCGWINSVFRPNPQAHILLEALEKWPNEYYWLIETGVSSRILGIRAEGDNIDEARKKVAELLKKVQEQWSDIGTQNTSNELTTYFREHNLVPIAEAIDKTLAANAAYAPNDKEYVWLQARAIKQGLIDAFNKMQEELKDKPK
ncbi:MAG: hypothetical protein ILNGONEN_01998 [Syntrophorhabdaceae bacterium]|nr:hypothetical protein [Syntrophorhabdaceae bacterium]